MRISDIDFGRAKVGGFDASGTTFVRCDFSRVRFRSGFLSRSPQARYVGCSFSGTDLRPIRPGPARFEDCDFRRAKLVGWDPEDAEFVDCRFVEKLRNVLFSGRPVPQSLRPDSIIPPRDVNEFHGNDFRECELVGVRFGRGIDLDAQRLPSGPGYRRLDRLHERVAHALAVVARWPNDREREMLLAMLRYYSSSAFDGQHDLLLETASLDPLGAEVAERLVAAPSEPPV